MQTTETTQRTIDVSGLPEEAVRAVESLVALIRGKTSGGVSSYPSVLAWSQALREWAASHARLDTVADDSRESIYAGRGE
jgi:hypothetical protein